MFEKSTVTTLSVLVLMLFALAGSGCERVVARPSPALKLTLQVRHLFNGKLLRLDDATLTNETGNTLSVSRLAYLVSDVTLLRPDGTPVRLDGQFAYLNPAQELHAQRSTLNAQRPNSQSACLDPAQPRTSCTLANVPPGRYAGLSFHVGLSPQENHADPSAYPAGHPLNPLVNHLHWGWQGGYVFLALEGRYVQPDGKLGGYSYHIATDKNLMTVHLAHELTLERDSVLGLRFDIARLFDARQKIAIHPNGGDSTHSADGDSLAVQLKDNAERSFEWEGIAPDSGAKTVSTPGTSVQARTIASAQSNPMTTARAVPPARVSPNLYISKTTSYALPIPAHFPQPQLPADNPLTIEGVALGRKLFFERKLSGDNTQSCANCHQPEHAFSDGGRAVSIGITGKAGTRHAMPLFNLAWSSAFTWDGRRTRLRDQALAPIQDVREMHQTLQRTVTKLSGNKAYARLFAAAFGSLGITPERLGLAIEQYLYTLISADSKFDRALRGEAQFTDAEKRGLLLFITEYDPARGKVGADCFHCHGGNLFTDDQFHNNGLDTDFRDKGRYQVTRREADRGKFKTPSLRNVALTAPYMHDGRFKSLEAVMDHYSTGIRRTNTLDPNIAKHPEGGVHLSAENKQALIAFLKTLTDPQFRAPSAIAFSKHPSEHSR